MLNRKMFDEEGSERLNYEGWTHGKSIQEETTLSEWDGED